MMNSMEIEIDENGVGRPIDPTVTLPCGRAFLIVDIDPIPETSAASEALPAFDSPIPREDALVLGKDYVMAENGLPMLLSRGKKLTPEMVKDFSDSEI